MSAGSVTCMIIWPLRALSWTPSTSMLTRSSLIADSLCRRRLSRHDRATLVLDHVLKLGPKMLHETLHGPRRRVAERADRVALDSIGNVDEHRQVLASALPRENPVEHAIEPTRALAARRALAAGLGHIEARQALERAHHAGGFVHHDHRPGADRGAGLSQGIIVHVDVLNRRRRQHVDRGAARNHGLELAPLPDAAGERQ